MKELTRRRFLQVGATGAAGLILADGLWHIVRAAEDEGWAPRLARMGEPIPTTCGMCPSGCGLLCYLEGDQLKGIFGHPDHPANRGKICARGLASLNILSDPDRVLYPLKRTGKRGEGKWKRITWDEAYDVLSSKISVLLQEGRAGSIVFDLDREELMVTRYLDALGQPTVLDRSLTANLNQRMGRRLSWGFEEVRVNPLESSYILIFGANPLEHHESYMSFVQAFIEARADRKTRLITLDVRHSSTAAKSDESFLLRPGTDGLVALAMANLILTERWYDQEFMQEHANYPVDLLIRHLSSYTVERAAALSGVNGADIRRMARDLATNKPAAVLSGGGVSRHDHGLQNERAVMLLNAVTGNIGVEGGLSARIRPAMPVPPPPYPLQRRTESGIGKQPSSLLGVWEREQNIDLLVACRSNPAYDDPEPEKTRKLLLDESRLPLSVVLETNMTETAALADMVLPLATSLESWDLHWGQSIQGDVHLSLQQPVVQRQAEPAFLKAGARISSPPFRPLGQARAFGDVCLELAQRIGGDVADVFPFHSSREYVEQIVARFGETEKAEGIGYLRKHGFRSTGRVFRERDGGSVLGGFNTPSGKYEIYSETMRRMGYDPLPTWAEESPKETRDGSRFTLITFQPHLHTERTANCKWLVEMSHEHPVWINTGRARQLDIEEGETVRISSSVGSITARVHVTECIHEEAVAVARGYGHWEWGQMARARKARSVDPDTQLVWWGKSGNGAHSGLLIPFHSDPAGGGQVWQGIEVEIAKIP